MYKRGVLNLPGSAKGHLALIIAGFIFGANYAIAKSLMPEAFSPLQIIFIRVLGALILFFIISLFFKKERFSVKDIFTIAIASFFGIAVNQVLFFTGLNLTTPVNASVIHASSPVLVVLFSALISRERITAMKIAGIVLGGVGAVTLILYQHVITFDHAFLKGNIFILINITAYSLYLVIIKPVMSKYNPVWVMRWVFLFGFIWVAPVTLSSLSSIDLTSISVNSWLALIYVVAGTTTLAYLLTTYGLRYLNASVVGYYIYMQPLVAAVIAWLWFDDKVTPPGIVAALLIFIGVFLVSKSNKNIVP